ncbi:MAG: hypothetical protein ACR2MY_02005 [Candidatus Dormibacteria bacterium]
MDLEEKPWRRQDRVFNIAVLPTARNQPGDDPIDYLDLALWISREARPLELSSDHGCKIRRECRRRLDGVEFARAERIPQLGYSLLQVDS